MPNRIAIAGSDFASVLGRIAWRLGLGWLFGRWFVLITTNAEDGRLDRRIAPYAFGGGIIYVVAPTQARWPAHLSRRPVALAQAHVGPLAVRTRRANADEQAAITALFADRAPALTSAPAADRWVLEPTGDRAPEMLAPDLLWVWFAAGAAWILGRLVASVSR